MSIVIPNVDFISQRDDNVIITGPVQNIGIKVILTPPIRHVSKFSKFDKEEEGGLPRFLEHPMF